MSQSASKNLAAAVPQRALTPVNVRLEDAQRISGFSRSGLYRRAAAGEIIFRKDGSRVLVDFASLKAAMEALPVAKIKSAA